jgi:DNA-binding MarR family transcriptional regulator
MGRDRPLGEARVLWEITPSGSAISRLGDRLGLDSGYLSRLLRALEADGLIEVVQDTEDRRSRIARLTALGQDERATLDLRSDELACSLLRPLNASQRDRLVAAMGEVERLLTAAAVQIVAIDPEHGDARFCLEQYTEELNRRSQRRFDPMVGATVRPDELRPPAGQFFIDVCSGPSNPARATPARPALSSKPTATSPKRSRSTPPLGGRKPQPSTTSRTRTDGSRNLSADPHETEAEHGACRQNGASE